MKILLIRPGALGDTILTLPVIDAIRSKHPDSEITLLGSSQFSFLLPQDIRTVSYESREWAWIFEASPCHNLPSKTDIDVAYVVLKNSNTVVRNLHNAGIPTIVASSSPQEGVSLVQTLCRRLCLPDPQRKAWLEQFQTKRKYNRLWVAPGSGSRKKNAPIALFSEAVRVIREHHDVELVVTLGESDRWFLDDEDFVGFTKGSNAKTIHDSSLQNIMLTCCNSVLYIGNDSGASHLAAALNIPAILFFTVTDPQVWGPFAPTKNLLFQRVTGRHIIGSREHEDLLRRIAGFATKHISESNTRYFRSNLP